MPCVPVLEYKEGVVHHLVQNPVTNSNPRHIGVRHHFIRNLDERRILRVLVIHVKIHIKDAVPRESLEIHCNIDIILSWNYLLAETFLSCFLKDKSELHYFVDVFLGLEIDFWFWRMLFSCWRVIDI